MTDQICVLLVEDDPSMRALLRFGLESEGAEMIAAESIAQARALLDEHFEAAILDRHLPDGRGDWLVDALLERLPRSRVIVHSSDGPIGDLPAVEKGDFETIARLLDLHQTSDTPPATKQARRSLGRLHRSWIELCRWDPAIPPDVRPPIAETVINAVTKALERPQPIGWGLDPALEPVASAFGLNAGDVRVALAELVCLREAFTREVVSPLEERGLHAEGMEAMQRLQMIIERTMLVVADTGVRRLHDQALTDELTGLWNRRSFEQDLERELERAARSDHSVCLAVIDVDNLKRVNDSRGHAAGDQLLRRLGRALTDTTRSSDRAYRIGGDEFALILVEAGEVDPEALRRRLLAAGAPDITVGTASSPPEDPANLFKSADLCLYAQRGRTRTKAST